MSRSGCTYKLLNLVLILGLLLGLVHPLTSLASIGFKASTQAKPANVEAEAVASPVVHACENGSCTDTARADFEAGTLINLDTTSEPGTVRLGLRPLPVANAGPDLTFGESETITLDGSASFSPTGDPLSYTWTQTTGPAGTLYTSDSSRPIFAHTQAQRPTIHYVAPNRNCGGAIPCYAAIQNAVDAALDGDTVKVARGMYTSMAPEVISITKAITLTGGYTVTDWSRPNPVTHPTVIDAKHVVHHRGVYIRGSDALTITLEGFTVQNGLTIPTSPGGGGGGIIILGGRVMLRECRILGNFAYYGGGVYVKGGSVILSRNTFQNNSAVYGGGVLVGGGAVVLSENTFQDNQGFSPSPYYPDNYGGGVSVYTGTVALKDNTFQRNSAVYGGGLDLSGGTVTLSNNTFQYNSASYSWRGSYGGGVFVGGGTVNLYSNTILSNTATGFGGGIAVRGGNVNAQNDVIANNTSLSPSCNCGIYLFGGALTARHWTLVNNGEYALMAAGGTAVLTNTIVMFVNRKVTHLITEK